MSMKTPSAPRRVYKRHGVLHTLIGGAVYGTFGDSKISVKSPVRIIERTETEIKVSQFRGRSGTFVETWHVVQLPKKSSAENKPASDA
jgi:hypothetical protein